MTSITILGKHLTDAELGSLKALACEAGALASQVAVVDAVCAPDPEVGDCVVLLLGTPATCAASDLERNLADAASGAQRAVWVWPKDSNATELPSPAAKYSYSCVPWDAEKLRAVVADDDVTCFETAAGDPIPKVPTERNLCVEENAKTK